MDIPSMPASGRLLPMLTADGHTQMALDALLLRHSTTPVLRFYRWQGPWLSLGRHQRQWPSQWNALAASGDLQLVRRPSGGSAVLHAGGLTYALIWPDPPRQRKEAYRQACQWLIDGFSSLGLPLQFGSEPAIGNKPNCFASATAADLVDPAGIKRVGSAQRWQRGRLLQHGEIVLDPPTALWQRVFGEPAPTPAPPGVPRSGLDHHLQKAFMQHWWRQNGVLQPLDHEELQELKEEASSPSL